MKNLVTLLAVLFCVVMTVAAATRTLNNNNPTPGQYTTIAAAIAASTNGDTILVSGSQLSYGHAYFTKQIVLIGTGHRPQNQDSVPCKFDHLRMQDAGAGSKVYGITTDYILMEEHNTNNNTFRRCRINGYVYNASTPSCHVHYNNVFEECVFTATGTVNVYNVNNDCYSISGWIFRNCVFNGQIYARGTSNYNNVFDHCIFLGNGNLQYSGLMRGLSFNNCIFYRTNPSNGINPATPVTFTNCLSHQCGNNSFTASNCVAVNCLTGVDPQFVDFPAAGALFAYGHDYGIQNGSPADNYGTDGTDLGVAGGLLNVWDINGIPHIPQVRELNVITPSVSQGSNLQINVKSYIPR